MGINLGAVFTGAAVSRGGYSQMVSLEESSVLLPSVRSGDVYTLLPSGRAAPAGPVLPPVTSLADTLRGVLGTVRQLEREAPTRVVLARPAAWAGNRQPEFAEMARLAGLPEAEFLSETESIVTYFASRGRVKAGDLVAVHDLGGRSFSAAVARYTSSGISVLGDRGALTGVSGEVFDDLVMAHVNQATGGSLTGLDLSDPALVAARQRVREQCVRAKEALSQDDEARVVVLLPGRHTEVRITRAEFESLIQEKVKATVATLGEALESAGAAASDLASVLLVGGSSRIPEVVKAVSAEFGRPVLTDPHPQHCVTLGAAFIAGGSSIADASEAAASTERPAGRRRPRGRMSPAVRFAPVLSSAGSAPSAPAAAVAGPAVQGSDGPDRPDRPEPAVRPTGSPRPARKWGRRVIVGLLVLAVLGAGGAYRQRSRSGGDVLASPGPSATVTGLPLASASAPPTSTPATPTGKTTARPTKKAAAPARKPTATSNRASVVKPKATTRPKTTTVQPVLGTGFLVGPGGKCLDVQNRVSKPGQLVQIFECNQSTAQIWTANGTSLKALGYCLDSASADGQMQINTCDGSAGQKWQIRGTTVINPSTTTCLDVLGGSAEDYTPTVSLTCRSTTRQIWKLT